MSENRGETPDNGVDEAAPAPSWKPDGNIYREPVYGSLFGGDPTDPQNQHTQSSE